MKDRNIDINISLPNKCSIKNKINGFCQKLMDKSKETVEHEEIKNNQNWQKTWMCIHIRKTSYRQKEGTGHAICSDGKCKIHHDKANPLQEPLKHIILDSPYRLVKTIFYPAILVYLLFSK